MSMERNDLDRLGEQAVASTEAAEPTMAWIAERSGQLRQRRRILIATVAAPALVLFGLVGWLTVGRDSGTQSIESIDQPDAADNSTGDLATDGTDGAERNGNDADQTTADGQTVRVPNAIGLTDEKAFDLLDEAGLEVEWDWVSDIAGGAVPASQVVGSDPEPGTEVAVGETVVLFFYRPEQEIFSAYDDPGLQANPLYPLVLDPADLGPEWGEFFLATTTEAILMDPATDPDLSGCAMEPVIVRNGYIAEYGFGESPDDAIFLVSTGTPEELKNFYDNYQLAEACQGPGPLERIITPLPEPELPGVIEATLATTADGLGQRSEVLLIHHPDVVYLLDIAILDDAEPFDIVALATELLQAFDTANQED